MHVKILSRIMIYAKIKHTSQAGMVYKQIVSADALSGVIAMPQTYRNKRVEVIIREVPESVRAPKIHMADIGRMMDGSITQSLIGIVPIAARRLTITERKGFPSMNVYD
jgi:hypothetical protein